MPNSDSQLSGMYTVDQVAQHIGGEVIGDGSLLLRGIAPADSAREGDLTFADSEIYLKAAQVGSASAVIIPAQASCPGKVAIRTANVRVAIARVLPLFAPSEAPVPGVHPTAVVHPSAAVDPSAEVGPHCVIAAGVTVGARSVLMGGNHLGRQSRVGEDSRLYPNAVLYAGTVLGNRVVVHAGTVIGSDGYGYVLDGGVHRKVLQLGNVVVHDDVEIGANAALDRGALGATVIGKGTKIDNLVHVAHNVVMGRHCLIMGQVGFAGSTRLGDYCVVASQSGIAGHLTLGDQAMVGAKSGVMRDVPAKGVVLGIPAQPDRQTKRQWVGVQQLPEMIRRLRELEKQVADLTAENSER